MQGTPHDNQSWCARTPIWEGVCTLTSSNHRCPQHAQTQSDVMPVGPREGKVLESTLPSPQESHGRAARSLSLSSRFQSSQALDRVLREGHLGQDHLAAWVRLELKKALRERKEGIALEGRETKVTNYIPSEANIKNLIRSCATVLLQSRHPFIAVPLSSYALFHGQLSLKVPPSTSS